MDTSKINIWKIGIKRRGEDIFDLSDIKILEPPKGFYWADPFLYGEYLFYELYNYDKGVIAYSKINEDLTLTKPNILLELQTHCSFPFLFSDKEYLYMTVENVLSGQLKIYKMSKDMNVLKEVKTVAYGRFDDPVIYKEGDVYKILATEDGDKLVVFQCNDILGEWRITERKESPCSRGAGKPFEYKGRMLRPTQDWIPDYGKAVVIKDMVTDSEVRRIEKETVPGSIGIHTFNFNDKYVVIDAKFKL